jgi:hypothetical protein
MPSNAVRLEHETCVDRFEQGTGRFNRMAFPFSLPWRDLSPVGDNGSQCHPALQSRRSPLLIRVDPHGRPTFGGKQGLKAISEAFSRPKVVPLKPPSWMTAAMSTLSIDSARTKKHAMAFAALGAFKRKLMRAGSIADEEAESVLVVS